MERTSYDKCLKLLEKLSDQLEQDESWPELKGEIDELIAEIEEERSRPAATPELGSAKLERLALRTAWLIRILFGLSGEE